MIEKLEFSIVGEEKMRCGGCESRVRFALQRLPGVVGVRADSETQTIAVSFDSQRLGASELQQLLKTAGYKVAVSPRMP